MAERGRGGRRDGAGRKPLEGGSKTAAFVLSPAHVDTIERWRQKHNLKSASEALRAILEKVRV